MGPAPAFASLFLQELARLGAGVDREVVFHERIDSTSTELRRRIESGAATGTVVAAAAQDAGRGRQGNRWYSPAEGNLYLSLAVRLDQAVGRESLLPLAAGVALWDAVERSASVGARLKWPNDLLVDGRKLAGILCELVGRGRRPGVAIVGLGVNFGTVAFPGELGRIAVSLCGLTDDVPMPAVLAARWVAGVERWLGSLAVGRDGDLIDAWRERAEPFGRRVRIRDIEGTTWDIAPDGRLILQQQSGEKTVVSGGVLEYV